MTIDSIGHKRLYGMVHDSQFHASVNHVPVVLIMWRDSSAMSLLIYFHPVKRARDDSGGLPDWSGPLCSKISLPTIEAVNVEVCTVRESQDTPSRSLYHVPFTHVWTYPVATQKGVADLCLYQLQCMCKCMCIPVLRFSHYVTRDNKAMIKWTHWHSSIFYWSKFSNSSKFSTVKNLRHTVTVC